MICNELTLCQSDYYRSLDSITLPRLHCVCNTTSSKVDIHLKQIMVKLHWNWGSIKLITTVEI